MKPHIKKRFGFWACGLPRDGADKWYCGGNPVEAFYSWSSANRFPGMSEAQILLALMMTPDGRQESIMLRDPNYPRGVFTYVGKDK